jgi:hypothetical protein
LLVLPLVVALLAVVSLDVHRSQQNADERARASDLLVHVEVGVQREHTALARALASLSSVVEARAEIRAASSQVAADVERLNRFDPDGDQQRTAALVSAFEDAVARELTLLEEGRSEAARAVDRSSTAARLAELTSEIESLRPKELAEAEAAQAGARRGRIAVVLAGLLGILMPLVMILLLGRRSRRPRRGRAASSRARTASARSSRTPPTRSSSWPRRASSAPCTARRWRFPATTRARWWERPSGASFTPTTNCSPRRSSSARPGPAARRASGGWPTPTAPGATARWVSPT